MLIKRTAINSMLLTLIRSIHDSDGWVFGCSWTLPNLPLRLRGLPFKQMEGYPEVHREREREREIKQHKNVLNVKNVL